MHATFTCISSHITITFEWPVKIKIKIYLIFYQKKADVADFSGAINSLVTDVSNNAGVINSLDADIATNAAAILDIGM